MHRRKGDEAELSPDQDGQRSAQVEPEVKVHSQGRSWGKYALVLLLLGLIGGGVYLFKASGAKSPATRRKVELFTKEELKRYDGSNPDLPIYLAIIGDVFDVTRGKQHYGPGMGYSFFAGVDGTRAFVTGEFNETGLIESVEGLPVSQVNDIQGWRDFYYKDYIYLGKLIGHYYDEKGKPTKNHARFQELLEQHKANALVRQEWDKRFPGCNSKWDQNEGSEVWCSDQSGGITRGWGGVPRLYVGPDYPKRCGCVEESKLSTLVPKDYEVYPGCDPLSPLCKVQT